MKKVLIFLIAVLALGAVTFFSLRGQFGVTDPAQLIPKDSPAVLMLPDLPRTGFRWQESTLAKIGKESDVAEFFAQPMKALEGLAGSNEAKDLLMNLKPGRVFAAITSLSEGQVVSLVGVQYWGAQADYDKAVERFAQQLNAGTAPTPTKDEFNGVSISVYQMSNGESLLSATAGKWGLLSNNPECIEMAITRAMGKSTDPSLLDSPEYQQTKKNLNEEPDLLAYAVPGPVLDFLTTLGAQMGATVDEQQLAEARQARAIGFTFKIDGPDFRDAAFVLKDDLSVPKAMSHSAMQFTSADTVGYFDARIDLNQFAEAAADDELAAVLGPQQAGALEFIKLLPEAFGDEVGVALNWPAGTMIPEVLAALPVSDTEKADKVMRELAAFLPEASVQEAEGVKIYSFPTLRSTFIDPCIAVRGDLAVAALTQEQLRRLLSAPETQKNLADLPSFAAARPAFGSANEAFGYIDSKAVFEQAFPLVRQMLTFGVALMPQASEWVDTTKVPETASIAQHLTPMVYSQTVTSEGVLVESSGPITMNQAILIGTIGGSMMYYSSLATGQ